jgi:hypothetical protein
VWKANARTGARRCGYSSGTYLSTEACAAVITTTRAIARWCKIELPHYG